MQIKEHLEIIKDGKKVVSKTSDHYVVKNFVDQMTNRNNTTMCFFVNKKKLKEYVERNDTEDGDEIPVDVDAPGSAYWSGDFSNDELMQMVLSYLSSLPPKMRLAFASQLNNQVVNNILVQESPDD